MENKVIIIFMVILFDENDNIIDRHENQLKIDSKLQPKLVKVMIKILLILLKNFVKLKINQIMIKPIIC